MGPSAGVKIVLLTFCTALQLCWLCRLFLRDKKVLLALQGPEVHQVCELKAGSVAANAVGCQVSEDHRGFKGIQDQQDQ
eukprot:gene9745-9903_t